MGCHKCKFETAHFQGIGNFFGTAENLIYEFSIKSVNSSITFQNSPGLYNAPLMTKLNVV